MLVLAQPRRVFGRNDHRLAVYTQLPVMHEHIAGMTLFASEDDAIGLDLHVVVAVVGTLEMMMRVAVRSLHTTRSGEPQDERGHDDSTMHERFPLPMRHQPIVMR